MSRTENSLRNIKFGMINRIESIVLPFIFRTLIIYYLGEEYTGLNSLFSSILQVLNVTELGFGTAIAASMYAPIANHDTKTVNALLNLYRKIYNTLAVIILVSGVVLLPFLPHLIKGNPPAGVNIYWLFIIYLANTVISYSLFAYRITLINANQRSDLSEKAGAICKLIIAIPQLLAIVFFKNILFYCALNTICTALYNLYCAYTAKKYFPEYYAEGILDNEIKTKIQKDVIALSFSKIGEVISLSFDTIIISAFLSLSAVAYYDNYNYIMSALNGFIGLLYAAIVASVGNSLATESIEKNYTDYRKFYFLNEWIIGWCCICVACLSQDFIQAWIGTRFQLPMWVVLTLVARFFFLQIRRIDQTYKDAAGIWWADRLRPIVGSVFNFVLNVLLVRTLGIAGVALSTVASYVLIEIPWETHALFSNYFKHSMREHFSDVLKEMTALVISGIVTFFACRVIPADGILGFILKAPVCLAIPNAFFYFLFRKNELFVESSGFLTRILKKTFGRFF